MERKKGSMEWLEKISIWIEQRVAPPLVKFGNQRHMAAIRSAMIRIIPLIIVGSIPLIFTSLPFETLANIFAPIAPALNILNGMTMGFMSLFLAVSLGAEFAKMYKMEPITVAMVSLACFLVTAAPIEEGAMSVGNFGGGGMFTVFITTIIVAEFMRFCRDKNIGIKMPEQVPETISASFSALVPMAILLVFFWVISVMLKFDITAVLSNIISPLMSLTDTWYAVVICTIFLTALWFVGIHGGSFTVWGVLYPFLVAGIAENAAARAAGEEMVRVFTEPFVSADSLCRYKYIWRYVWVYSYQAWYYQYNICTDAMVYSAVDRTISFYRRRLESCSCTGNFDCTCRYYVVSICKTLGEKVYRRGKRSSWSG